MRTFIACLFISISSSAFAAPGVKAPVVSAAKAGKNSFADSHGRIRYIIDLEPNAPKSFPTTPVPASEQARFQRHHSERMKNLVIALERAHGFKSVSVTSHIGPTVTAYLSLG